MLSKPRPQSPMNFRSAAPPVGPCGAGQIPAVADVFDEAHTVHGGVQIPAHTLKIGGVDHDPAHGGRL